MKFLPTRIPDVILIEPQVFQDERGFFLETFQEQQFYQAGISIGFVQDNHSGSKKAVLRGLHYQIKQAQGKLIRIIQGQVFDVCVDIRRSSPTFGKYVGLVLSAEDKQQLWIPPGFAHGFYVMSDWAEVIYKTTDYYAPQWERTILWSDPILGIEWPFPDGFPPILSTKDAQGCPLMEAEVYE